METENRLFNYWISTNSNAPSEIVMKGVSIQEPKNGWIVFTDENGETACVVRESIVSCITRLDKER